MRIAIDARFANLKVGIGRVAYNLTKEIILLDNENSYVLLLGEKDPFEDIKKDNVKKIKNPSSTKKKLTWQFIYLPYILKKEKIDIFFSTENFIIPPFFKGKTVTTIHDLIPLVFREYLQGKISPYKLKVYMSKLFPPVKFMTVSNFSKEEIKRVLKVSEKNIFVIKEGFDQRLKSIKDESNILHNLEVNKPYILGIGGMEMRKNNKVLIDAFLDMIENNTELKHSLVIVGRIYSKKVPMDIREIPESLSDRVKMIIEVSDEELAVLYKNAEIFVYPTIYEGFGLPPLESFKHRTPVITSNITSIPEVVKDAAILINPYKKEEIEDAMMKIIRSDSLKSELIDKGISILRNYDWSKSAEKVIKEFRKIYEEK